MYVVVGIIVCIIAFVWVMNTMFSPSKEEIDARYARVEKAPDHTARGVPIENKKYFYDFSDKSDEAIKEQLLIADNAVSIARSNGLRRDSITYYWSTYSDGRIK